MNKSVCGVLLLSLMACQSPQKQHAIPQDTEQLVGAYTHAPAAQRQVLQWDTYFQDPALKDLLGQALAANKDLQLDRLQILRHKRCMGYSAPMPCPASMLAWMRSALAALLICACPLIVPFLSNTAPVWVCKIVSCICGDALSA